MGDRITIVLKSENTKKVRILQSKLIANSTKSVSFSAVINQLIEKGLKK